MHSSRFTLRNAKIQKFKTNSYALTTFSETSVILPGTDSPHKKSFSSEPCSHSSGFFCLHRTADVETKAENTIYTYKILSLNHCAWFMRPEFSCRLWQLRNKGMELFMEGPLPSGQTHPTAYLAKEGRGMQALLQLHYRCSCIRQPSPAALPSSRG